MSTHATIETMVSCGLRNMQKKYRVFYQDDKTSVTFQLTLCSLLLLWWLMPSLEFLPRHLKASLQVLQNLGLRQEAKEKQIIKNKLNVNDTSNHLQELSHLFKYLDYSYQGFMCTVFPFPICKHNTSLFIRNAHKFLDFNVPRLVILLHIFL